MSIFWISGKRKKEYKKTEEILKLKIEIVQKLLKDGMIAEEETDIVEYGLRNMLHNLAGIFITLIIGWIFRNLKEGVILLLLIFPLRKYAGGFHANTRKGCLFSSICLLVISFEIFFKIKWTSEGCIFLSIIFFFIILVLVPVENPNKPLDDLEHRVYGRRAKTILIIELVMLGVSLLLKWKRLMIVITMNFCMVGFILIAGVIKLKYYCKKGKEYIRKI